MRERWGDMGEHVLGNLMADLKPGTRFLLQIVEVNPPHHLVRFPAGGALEDGTCLLKTDERILTAA